MNKLIIAMLGVCALTMGAGKALAAEGVTVGGFVDAQWGFDDANEGARIGSGQLQFVKQTGNSMVKVEVPFTQTTGTSDMPMGMDYGQAYVKHSYANGLSWALGQWDGIFGLERNDAPDIQFTKHGAMFNYQPRVNTGLLVDYKINETMMVQAYVSGVKDSGGTDSGRKPEFGAKFAMTGDMKFGVGTSVHDESPDVRRMYVNSTFGMNAAGVDIGAEVSYEKAGKADAQTGVGVIAGYSVAEGITVGARVQSLSRFGNYKQTDVTLGPQFEMSKELRVKADFNMASVTATEGATATTVRSGALAAVYVF